MDIKIEGRIVHVDFAEQPDEVVTAAAEEVAAELETRGLKHPIGSLATEGAVSEADAMFDSAKNTEVLKAERLAKFLDPEIEMSFSDQMDVMTEFLADCGYEVPELDDAQRRQARIKIAMYPGRRIVPTPLVDLAGRVKLAQISDDERLILHSNIGVRAQLVAKPDAVIPEGMDNLMLAYKTPSGDVKSRTDFLEELLASGQAVKDTSGVVWTYPIADIRSSVTANDSHAYFAIQRLETDPVNTAEMGIIIMSLHRRNGSLGNCNYSYVNEAIRTASRDGKMPLLRHTAAAVTALANQIIVDFIGTDREFSGQPQGGVRDAESAI